MEEKYLTVHQVAEILHVRIETVRRYIQQGAIIALILPGGDYRIAESELNKLLNRVTAGHGSNTKN
ncbi:MAG: helix-turn-helix domain-containing protein [Dehalococcoidia bacterium]